MLGEAASGRTKFGKKFCFQWDPVFPHNIAYVIYKDNAFMHEIQSLLKIYLKIRKHLYNAVMRFLWFSYLFAEEDKAMKKDNP